MGVLAKDFFTTEEQENINLAIKNAELDTSGEIRVHIENVCAGEVLDRAAYLFKHLGMTKTELRNGVLVYLAVKNRKFAIIGDVGINKVVPPDFWAEIKHKMLNHFREDKFELGLCDAIKSVGEQLKTYFPHKKDDVNELPDDISFGEN
jgi:uncharacterized membrane protein